MTLTATATVQAAAQPGTRTAVLWGDDNGRLVCQTRCAGGYLTAGLAARPKAKSHRTPLGTWRIVTAADIADWDAYGDLPPMSCESCGAVASQPAC